MVAAEDLETQGGEVSIKDLKNKRDLGIRKEDLEILTDQTGDLETVVCRKVLAIQAVYRKDLVILKKDLETQVVYKRGLGIPKEKDLVIHLVVLVVEPVILVVIKDNMVVATR